MVEEEYDELFPGEVLAVQPVFNTTKLEPLDKEYDKLSQKLWDLIGAPVEPVVVLCRLLHGSLTKITSCLDPPSTLFKFCETFSPYCLPPSFHVALLHLHCRPFDPQ